MTLHRGARVVRNLGAVALALGLFSAAAHCQGETIPREAYKYQRALIANTRSVWGLDAPTAVFAAQIHQESGWRADAKSKFASGLCQFTPATADWIDDVYPELRGDGPTNPAWCLRALARYDHYLWDRVAGRNDCERWAFTLSAYNGGLGWVQRDSRLAVQRGADPKVWFGSVELYNAGRAPQFFAENRGYPRRILLIIQPRYLAWGPGITCYRI